MTAKEIQSGLEELVKKNQPEGQAMCVYLSSYGTGHATHCHVVIASNIGTISVCDATLEQAMSKAKRKHRAREWSPSSVTPV
jgi:hypothetical protein